MVDAISSRHSGELTAVASTTRPHNIAGKYTGKDDPVMLVRLWKNIPATGEILAPYATAHYVGRFMRGSHIGPLMLAAQGTGISHFLGFCVHQGS